MSSEEGIRRIWERLDEINTKLTRLLTLQDERDKDFSKLELCLADLKKRVQKLELDRSKVIGGAIVFSLGINAVWWLAHKLLTIISKGVI